MQMAVKVSHPLPCFFYVCTNTSSSIHSIRGRRVSPVAYLCRRPKLKFVDRVVSKCLSQKSPVGTENTENDPVTKPVRKEIFFFRFWSSESIFHLFCGDGNIWKIDELASEILAIALPAALALAADPIASLVDSAFVGHLGSVELAAVGVSISVFNLVSKLFNVPLLNITTSFVAEEQALVQEGGSTYQIATGNNEHKKLLPAVSTSLALATAIGISEMVVLSAGSGSLMNVMGITVDSPMRAPAEQFLTLRAFGAPPLVIALAVQGTFRGFKDTKTPLYAVGIGNLLNTILDPILIFLCGIGISGAAVATVISEYVIAFILLVELNSKVVLAPPIIDLVEGVRRFVKSGGLLTGRSIAVLATMTFATSMAAQLGPIPMAGHQICLQVWLAVSLLNDALALGGQALLAEAFAQGNYKQGRHVIFKVLQIGVVTGVALAIIMLIGFGPFSSIFSNDPAVLKTALSVVMFVAGSQPINALAFVIDGLYYGLSDFEYAAYSMIFAGLISSLFLLVAAPLFGLVGIWTGLILFMTLRVLAGFWRFGSKNGPWELIWSDTERTVTEE